MGRRKTKKSPKINEMRFFHYTGTCPYCNLDIRATFMIDQSALIYHLCDDGGERRKVRLFEVSARKDEDTSGYKLICEERSPKDYAFH